jgi:hypothetical protein
MAKISIINKRNIWKNLKKYLTFGLAAGVVYGGYWAISRTINYLEFSSKKSGIIKLVEKCRYEQAEQEFEELSEKGFIISGKYEKERQELTQKIRNKKITQLKSKLDQKDHTSASELVENFSDELYFSDKEIQIMEQKVEKIHPDKLIKIGDEENSIRKKISLYEYAERELRKLGEQRPELKEKIISAKLKSLQQDCNSKTTSMGNINYRIKKITENIASGYPNIPENNLKEFFESSKIYFPEILNLGNLNDARIYLDRIDNLAQVLEIQERQEITKDLTSEVKKHVISEIDDKDVISHYHLNQIDHTFIIFEKYNPEKLEDIVELYLTMQEKAERNDAGFQEEILDRAAIKAELLLEQSKSEMQIKIADRYFQLEEKFEGSHKTYLNSLKIRGLYQSAGLPSDDSRYKKLEKFSKALSKNKDN